MKYTISITDVAEYEVEADTSEEAKLQALRLWEKRTPYVLIKDDTGHIVRDEKKFAIINTITRRTIIGGLLKGQVSLYISFNEVYYPIECLNVISNDGEEWSATRWKKEVAN